jgi:hypothetical protein
MAFVLIVVGIVHALTADLVLNSFYGCFELRKT